MLETGNSVSCEGPQELYLHQHQSESSTTCYPLVTYPLKMVIFYSSVSLPEGTIMSTLNKLLGCTKKKVEG